MSLNMRLKIHFEEHTRKLDKMCLEESVLLGGSVHTVSDRLRCYFLMSQLWNTSSVIHLLALNFDIVISLGLINSSTFIFLLRS